MPKSAADYYTHHREEFEPFARYGYTSIKVLPELSGKKWDDVALGYCHALRPSCIRVTTGRCTADAVRWRVTVIVNDKGIIDYIEQEVQVGLPEGVVHGGALEDALRYGIDSEQVRWHHDCTGYIYTPEGYFKTTKDGRTVRYPDSKLQ